VNRNLLRQINREPGGDVPTVAVQVILEDAFISFIYRARLPLLVVCTCVLKSLIYCLSEKLSNTYRHNNGSTQEKMEEVASAGTKRVL